MNDETKVPQVAQLVCGDCVHVQPGPNTKNDIMSRNCYRFPPTAIGILAGTNIALVSARPEVRVDTVACGEYETDDPEEAA